VLIELRVRDLGVIEDLHLQFGAGMTAITGETGAGKTLVVDAIDLLLGGRADTGVVRAGADEALVEGRFAGEGDDGDAAEVVLAREVPAAGRSRAYVDGRMAPVSQLAEAGNALVDLHGQHAHQSLLAPAVQRAALDRFASIDLTERSTARQAIVAIDSALADLGGDQRSRAREIDLLRYQVEELVSAAVDDAGEDAALAAEESLLADAAALRDAAAAAWAALADDGGARDVVAGAMAAIDGREPFAALSARLAAVATELADAATELRDAGDALRDDPERLAEVQARRQLLTSLRRKYGESLTDVISYRDEAMARLADLESFDARAAALDEQRVAAVEHLAAAELAVGDARRAAAPQLAAAVSAHLPDLALGGATFAVAVGERQADPAGDEVAFLLSANPGEPARPLAKVASGGELARCMLALRLVLRDRTVPTLVFDEVDAGIGGQAAVTVGRALGALATDHQLFVVTHLPQVAAFADHHIAVTKDVRGGRSVATATRLAGDARVAELTRMLSGLTDSATGRDHAEELLATAQQARTR
jgi:DNA repair protein RecN (Recombination protein N)